MTIEEFVNRLDDGIAALERIAESLENLKQEAGWSRGEHEAEGRAVEAHQEEKHGDW